MAKHNPLIDDLRGEPGITVSLPSSGLFYENGVIDDDIDIVDAPVNAFNMMQEIHFQDFYSVTSGLAYEKLLKQCAPWVKNPNEMLQPDVDVIMIGARQASYGPKYEVEINCVDNDKEFEESLGLEPDEDAVQHGCGAKFKVSIDLREALLAYEPIQNASDWTLELDNGQTVLLRPQTYKSVIDTLKYASNRIKIVRQLRQNNLTIMDADEATGKQLSNVQDAIRVTSFLGSVKGARPKGSSEVITDIKMLSDWISALGSNHINLIEERIKVLNKPYKKAATFNQKCPECGYELKDISVINDPSHFFGPSSPA